MRTYLSYILLQDSQQVLRHFEWAICGELFDLNFFLLKLRFRAGMVKTSALYTKGRRFEIFHSNSGIAVL